MGFSTYFNHPLPFCGKNESVTAIELTGVKQKAKPKFPDSTSISE